MASLTHGVLDPCLQFWAYMNTYFDSPCLWPLACWIHTYNFGLHLACEFYGLMSCVDHFHSSPVFAI